MEIALLYSGLVEDKKVAEIIYSKVNQEYRSCIEVIEELTEQKIGDRYPNIVANIEKKFWSARLGS